jgi:hypothetical protein
MSATIVYGNVGDVNDVNGECHGTLFGGVRFYIHQKVPSRNRLLGDIKVSPPLSSHVSPSFELTWPADKRREDCAAGEIC